MPVVGFLSTESADEWTERVHWFRQGLAQIGYVEGRNVAIEYRWAEGQNDRLPGLATELVRLPASVIAVGGVPALRAARAATSSTPIVFQIGVDPVDAGFVASLSHPGGNLTGATNLSIALGPKRLELLHDTIPSARIVALLRSDQFGQRNRNPQHASRGGRTWAGIPCTPRDFGARLRCSLRRARRIEGGWANHR